MKRIISLLLLFSMLITNASAVVVSGVGVNGGTGTSSNTGFSLKTNVTGLAIGIQQMDGTSYTIKEIDADATGVNSVGMANVVSHFAASYPDPENGDLFYLLPNIGITPAYRTATGTGGIAQVPLQATGTSSASAGLAYYTYCNSSCSKDMTWANYLYSAAVSSMTANNPNPSINQGLVLTILNEYNESSAWNTVNWIFGASSNNQVDVATVNANYSSAALDCVITDPEELDDMKADQLILNDIQKICNQAALLMYVVKCMPSTNRIAYATMIEDYLTKALSGDAYQPIVITAEMCMAFEHDGNSTYNTWRTVPECIALLTGAPESAIRNADSGTLAGHINMGFTNAAQNISARASELYEPAGFFGGNYMLGIMSTGAENAAFSSYCRSMTAVSEEAMRGAEDQGVDPYDYPPWGCGIFGLDATVVQIIPPYDLTVYTSSSDPIFNTEYKEEVTQTAEYTSTISGSTNIAVEDVLFSAPMGAYQETTTLQITVDLSATLSEVVNQLTTYYQSDSGGSDNYQSWTTTTYYPDGTSEVTAFKEEAWSEEWADDDWTELRTEDSSFSAANAISFAECLEWHADKEAETGIDLDDPWVQVFVKQFKEVTHIGEEASSTIITESAGYYGDGSEFCPTPANPDPGWKPDVGMEPVGANNYTFVDLSTVSNIKLSQAVDAFTSVELQDDSYGIRITITDVAAATEYFTDNPATFVIEADVVLNGNIDSLDTMDQFWFTASGGASINVPADPDATYGYGVGRLTTYLVASTHACYTVVTPEPPVEYPSFYSTYKDPYSELKQGTVPTTGTGSDEQFNSMTGTPTFTDTSIREDFTDTPYEYAGSYYQYFASGGNEFIVQFDAEYVETASASRTYSASFNQTLCDLNDSLACPPCPGHTDSEGNTTYCGGHCQCNYHMSCIDHNVSDSYTWTQKVSGFSYVQITNAKVWQLSEARLDGTRELLDTTYVTAEIQSQAPDIFYNIASSNNSASGRLLYSYQPAQNDSVVIPGYPKTSDNSCSSHTSNNQATLDADTAGITCNAICVSDFLILRTTNGDQSIMYYEYQSKNDALINVGNCVAEDIVFDPVPYATIWTDNPYTSEGSQLPQDGITFGGYNGNYAYTDTKYASSGHPANIDAQTTSAWINASGAFDPTPLPNQKLLLMNDTLVIPDDRMNGEYVVGGSTVFYENILNYGSKSPIYPIVSQPLFDGKEGFTLISVYGPEGEPSNKINDVVVYNPVSNQNAIIVSLPEERDQRIGTHVVPGAEVDSSCPMDSSCEFMQNICTITDHLHTEDCYTLKQRQWLLPIAGWKLLLDLHGSMATTIY